MGKKTTISDISRATGFSLGTVSKALADSAEITVSTKERILKRAVEMGYSIGRKKANSKGTVAAVVQCGRLESVGFEYHMLFGFQLMATRNGYDVEIVHIRTGDPDWDFKRTIIERGFSGVFLLRIGSGYNIAAEIAEGAIPVVAFDQMYEASCAASIGCDNAAGIGLAVRHLVGLGHRKIAFFGGTPTALVSAERKKSFIAAVREAGLQALPELIAESNFSQNCAPMIIPGFLENGATAVVCASDLLAKYAMDEIEKNGLSVPEDVSIVGYDNVPLAEECTPPLTTVDQNIAEIGKSAFYLLENLMNGVPVRRMLFRPSLIVRKSTTTAPLKDQNEAAQA